MKGNRIMKKEYRNPQVEVIRCEASEMLCASGNRVNVSNSSWNGVGD